MGGHKTSHGEEQGQAASSLCWDTALTPGPTAPRDMGQNAVLALLGRQLPLPVFNAGAGGIICRFFPFQFLTILCLRVN